MFLIGFLVVWAGLTAYGIYKSAETALAVPTVSYDTTATTTDSETITKEKADITKEGESIIGLRDPVLIKRPSTLTTVTFDTTTYGDRAVLQLQNNTASAINLTGLSIRGKIVSQLAGQNGYVWEYSDYDAIEKEGEQFVEVSNDFIFDPTQAKQIGDFSWKELKPHKLYSVMLPGCHYEYEIGDVYHLALSHVMNGGTMEDIDTDTEIMGVSINRNVGGTGETLLNLRVPSAAWALTIAKNSKLTGAGRAQRLNNRSNVVTVASSTWTGQADYYCDGTDDDAEIQAAIDYVSSLGGGEILLTTGIFILSTSILINQNTILTGDGISSYISGAGIRMDSNSELSYISMDDNPVTVQSKSFINIHDIFIVGDTASYGIYAYNSTNISIKNCIIEGCTDGIYIDGCSSYLISGCTVYSATYGIFITNTSISLSGIIDNCICYSSSSGIRISGASVYRLTITNNTCYSNSAYGIYVIAVGYCIITNNRAYSNSTDDIYIGSEIGGTTNVITGNVEG